VARAQASDGEGKRKAAKKHCFFVENPLSLACRLDSSPKGGAKRIVQNVLIATAPFLFLAKTYREAPL